MMKGVILAAGKGSRLYPVTKVIPKPLLPILNRPTLDYAFDQMKACGITDVCIVVGENEQLMREELGDGTEIGLYLSYVRQTDPQGLAHAVGFAEKFVDGDDFVLYLGDAIYDQSLAPFVEQFNASGAANLNLVKEVEDPRRFGVANVENGRIVKLVEKPAEPESNLAMAGMYVFGPEIWWVLPQLKPSARGEYEITDAIQLLVDKGEVVVPGIYEGNWFDTGTLDSFLETSSFLAKGGWVVDESASVNAEMSGMVVIGAKAEVNAKSIKNSVILPGAKINVLGDIDGCLLGGEVTSEQSLSAEIRHGRVQ
ncbi:MAG: NTP transferase domain-containing protein [Fimbriimonadaceae bacterium]|nr:MAG: NTP transferase domain-containing protein [Fimbriimonadaceae bacterium]